MNPRPVLASLVVALALGITAAPGMAAPAASRLEGRAPDGHTLVTLDQPRGTVLDALTAIARQAGWILVVTAPDSLTSRSLALQIKARPAEEALDLVLEAGTLRATLADGVLKVRADAAAGASAGPRERRRERGRRGGPDRVVLGESLQIGADEVVRRAVAIGGSVTILGHVRGDAVAVGGSVTLVPGARVEGDAVAVGGTVTVEEGASLEGDNVSLGGTIPSLVGSIARGVVGGRPRLRHLFGLTASLARSVLLLAVTVLVAVVFPGPVTRVGAFLARRPGLSSLGGLALFAGFAPLCVLLAVTIVGIPLIPVAGMFLVALLVFGATVAALWLGERLPHGPDPRSPVKAVALGALVFALVGLIPWLGTLVILLAALVAAGATLLSRFGRREEAPAAGC